MEAMETTSRIRPAYRPVVLAKLDARTKQARLLRETRAALTAHVGGKPSAVQAAMIERAVQLTLRIADMDAKFAETGAMSKFRQQDLSGLVEQPDTHVGPARRAGRDHRTRSDDRGSARSAT
jgi:hypothetical protein